MHLWSYKDLNERARRGPSLAKNPRWNSEYVTAHPPQPGAPGHPPAQRGEGPGRADEDAQRLRAAHATAPGPARPSSGSTSSPALLPVREKYSKIVGLWTTEAGQPNEICHLWAYADLNARAAVRAESGKDPGWQAFLKSSTGLLDEMHSTIMLPAAHSPLK